MKRPRLLIATLAVLALGTGFGIPSIRSTASASGTRSWVEIEYYDNAAHTTLVGGRVYGCGLSQEWGVRTSYYVRWSDPCDLPPDDPPTEPPCTGPWC